MDRFRYIVDLAESNLVDANAIYSNVDSGVDRLLRSSPRDIDYSVAFESEGRINREITRLVGMKASLKKSIERMEIRVGVVEMTRYEFMSWLVYKKRAYAILSNYSFLVGLYHKLWIKLSASGIFQR
jgi:hypothetical protein